MTIEEYQQTPETLLPQELIDGVVCVNDAPFVSHQRVVFQLARALDDHARDTGAGEVLLAPVDVIFDTARALVLQPDIVFVSRDRAHLVRDRIHGAPDLVVEVLSPNPRIGELDQRLRWFAQGGVREIWLYHQFTRTLQILNCLGGRIAATATFDDATPLRSQVLPLFVRTIGSVFHS